MKEDFTDDNKDFIFKLKDGNTKTNCRRAGNRRRTIKIFFSPPFSYLLILELLLGLRHPCFAELCDNGESVRFVRILLCMV